MSRLLFRRASRRDQRGAVAVEAGLSLTFLLIPLLVGVVKYGDVFHEAQAVDMVTPPMVQTDVNGEPFWAPSGSCQSLADRIKQSMIDALIKANGDLFAGSSQFLQGMTVSLTSIPDSQSVYVNAGLSAPLTEWLAKQNVTDGYKNWANDWSGIVRNAWVEVPGGAGSCRA